MDDDTQCVPETFQDDMNEGYRYALVDYAIGKNKYRSVVLAEWLELRGQTLTLRLPDNPSKMLRMQSAPKKSWATIKCSVILRGTEKQCQDHEGSNSTTDEYTRSDLKHNSNKLKRARSQDDASSSRPCMTKRQPQSVTLMSSDEEGDNSIDIGTRSEDDASLTNERITMSQHLPIEMSSDEDGDNSIEIGNKENKSVTSPKTSQSTPTFEEKANKSVTSPKTSQSTPNTAQSVEDLTQKKFRKAVLRSLTELKFLIEDVLKPKADSSFTISMIETLDDFLVIEKRLADDQDNYTEKLVNHMVKFGGVNYSNHVDNILKKLMSDDVMILYSLKGQKTKHPFNKTRIYRAILAAVKITDKSATECMIDTRIASKLKHAPKRVKDATPRMESAEVPKAN